LAAAWAARSASTSGRSAALDQALELRFVGHRLARIQQQPALLVENAKRQRPPHRQQLANLGHRHAFGRKITH